MWSIIFVYETIFPNLISSIGLFGCMILFGTMSLLSAIFGFIFIPQTRGKSHEEIMRLLAKWPKKKKLIIIIDDEWKPEQTVVYYLLAAEINLLSSDKVEHYNSKSHRLNSKFSRARSHMDRKSFYRWQWHLISKPTLSVSSKCCLRCVINM